MKNLIKKINIPSSMFIAICLLAPTSHALLELRLHYGGLASNPDLKSIYTGTSDLPTVVPAYGLGGDIIFSPPLTDFGFGLRTEHLGLTVAKNSLSYESVLQRNAALLNYRFINTVLYLGPIFTYGISHNSSIMWKEGSSKADLEPENTSSYSYGMEVGVKMLTLMIGAEVGYQSLKLNRLKDKTGTTVEKPDLDMSGSYGKVILGFTI